MRRAWATALAVTGALGLYLGFQARTADAQTCPPVENQIHAVVESPIHDSPIVQAEEVIEIADPWFNTCPGGLEKKWVAQVMWLVDTSNGRYAEVGWRRECEGDTANDFMYYSYGTYPGGYLQKFVDSSYSVVVPNPGERYRVRISKVGAGSTGYNLWRFQVSRLGSAPIETRSISISAEFAPDRMDVGGENLFDVHDMGVSGHLEAEYLLGNGSLLFLNNQTVHRSDRRPRYRIVEGSGGYDASRYFQTNSNIHLCSPCPTDVPSGVGMCD